MARFDIDYEAGVAGQVPATSVSTRPGPWSINAAGTIVYDTTRASHGSMALRHSPASGNISYISYGNSSNINLNATSALAVRAYYYFTTLPNGGGFLSIFDSADQWVAGVGITAAGQLFMRDAGANPRATGTEILVPNQWLRIELYATAATTNATVTAAVYTGDSMTPTTSLTTTVGSTAATLSSVRIGKNNYTTYSTPYWVDSLAIDTAATGLIGPVISPQAVTPFRISTGSAYVPVDVRVWNGTAYESILTEVN